MSCHRWAINSVVGILGLVLFVRGFFPNRVTIAGFGNFFQSSDVFNDESGSPQFDRLILMVVDAMRSDFMYSENSDMNFLHSLIREGLALPFTAYSNPPTVTLPRLKGITTGSAPNFVDAILNIADDKDNSQSLLQQDSWVYQFKNHAERKRMHFFGDDTWLKLFPVDEFFESAEGTSSFFVKDFTEVDNNVTRHLHDQESESWDALILHYLGLDHIGHQGGPHSVHMKPKQAEMDGIFESLYNKYALNDEKTLIVLMGDHGMNEVGNHGGATNGETHPGMVFASPKLKNILGQNSLQAPVHDKEDFVFYRLIDQIDLVPTLAALFGFPIPKNNLGKLIPEFLALWKEDRQKDILLENCEQIFDLLKTQLPNDGSLLKSLDWLESIRYQSNATVNSYFKFLDTTQSRVVKIATNYKMLYLVAGVCLCIISSVGAFTKLLFTTKKNDLLKACLFCGFCFLYSIHFHGSSFVEEEHQIWWFLLVNVLVVSFHSKGKLVTFEFFGALGLLRILRGWCNSGQKFRSELTISDLLKKNTSLLLLLTALTYGRMIQRYVQLKKKQDKNFLWKVSIFSISGILSFLFKLIQAESEGLITITSLPILSNLTAIEVPNPLFWPNVFSNTFGSLLLLSLLWECISFKTQRGPLLLSSGKLITMFLLHQSRIEIIPTFLLFDGISNCLSPIFSTMPDHDFYLSAIILCLQNFSFFAIGNTNLIATIDLSNAYNGLISYNIFLVGVLTFVSNFAPAIYWSIFGLQVLFGRFGASMSELKRNLSRMRHLFFCFYMISTSSLLSSCLNLRYHLFIWSVFSPKVLYLSAWFMLVHFGIDSIIPTLLLCYT